MNMTRRTKITLAVVAGLIGIPVGVLIVLLTFDWNRAKPWLNARTSEILDRPFAINGDLSLTWEKPVAVGPSEWDEGWLSIIPWPYLVAQDVHIGKKIIRKMELPIRRLSTHLRLRDGVLSLLPLNFDMAGGKLSSNITLDGSGKAGKNAIKGTMKVTARRLKLKRLFPTFQPLQASAGEINGDASLSAVGNSVASSLGASNGEIKILINQGTVGKLFLEEMGLNIGSVILTRLVGDKQVKLNCMATDFGVTNGLIQTRRFIIDTDDAIIDVSGNINLAQEQLDLTINPNSKGLRVLSLRAPLYVLGSFMQPNVSIDKGVLAMKAGGAIALAAVAPAALVPVAVLVPLINIGPGDDSECARLLAEARVKPVAPRPGKTYHRKVKPKRK